MVEGNTGYGATGRAVAGLRGVRELTHACTSSTGTGEGCAPSRRIYDGTASGREATKPMMYGAQQSDAAIVAMKAANKGARVPAEPLERRTPTERNPRRLGTVRT